MHNPERIKSKTLLNFFVLFCLYQSHGMRISAQKELCSRLTAYIICIHYYGHEFSLTMPKMFNLVIQLLFE